MGYCDGLVCVKAYCNDDSLIFLWNPSTRDSRKLPYTPGVLRNHHFSCYGFGYDYNSDDYKVLIVVPPLDCYRDSSCKSMMYTLKTDTWRRIQDFPSDTRCLVWGHNPDRSATLVNGALHWMVKQTCNYLWVIISLNLTTETYIEVAKPDYYGVDQSSGIGIGVSNRDCLCLLVYNRAGGNYEFWVMKEYGVRESWTISAKISNRVEGGVYVLGLRPSTWFSENGKILFRPLAARELAIYNANNNSVTSLHQIPDDYSTAHGDVFVESLVSPYAYSNHRANDTNRLKINIGRMNRVVRNV
ncbi:F-box/kelch-repeat protein At3g06240-like [Argentina anserina]|uniref:F-box/kelch-repeat protein At3g06240-like n=1 Tax=Argentina anserina TaxID=57926 RepID=UPI0021765141|nr:F-box/kelch-repeat protein At3g06240-like [Potentilla anserina]